MAAYKVTFTKMKGEKSFMKKFFALLLAVSFLMSACSNIETPLPGEQSEFSSSIAVASDEQKEDEEQGTPSFGQEELEGEEEAVNDWQFDTPENHNMDPEVFEALHEALTGSGIHSVVTVKDGVIIDEYYEDRYDENSLFGIHSASKSFTGALIGIAINEGYIDNVDDLLSKYLPQVLEQEDEGKQGLTLRHLLTHTSGLEWYEWGGGYSNWNEFRSSENWVDYILGRELIYEPGTVFNYSTGNTHLLSAVLEAATGMTQEEYCRAHLFDPMGISEDAHWGTDPQGVADGGNGLFISARDAAKFGQLFLNNGNWNGEQLITEEWVEESTSAKNSGAGDSTGSYGYQWWVRSFTTGGYNTYATPYTTASYDTYFAFGYAGQFIFVVPELDLVVVFTSDCSSSYGPRPYFTDYILNAYMG